MTRLVPRKWGRFTHLLPYRRNNSLAGLRHAARYSKAIDLDVWAVGKRLINTHWHRPALDGFKGPLAQRHITTLSWRQIKGLRSTGGYRIRRVRLRLKQAAEVGVKRVELDAKGGAWLTDHSAWLPIAGLARDLGLTVVVKCSSRRPRYCGRVLRAAHNAGLPTILLPRGSRVMSRKWQPYIDYVRGAVIWR